MDENIKYRVFKTDPSGDDWEKAEVRVYSNSTISLIASVASIANSCFSLMLYRGTHVGFGVHFDCEQDARNALSDLLKYCIDFNIWGEVFDPDLLNEKLFATFLSQVDFGKKNKEVALDEENAFKEFKSDLIGILENLKTRPYYRYVSDRLLNRIWLPGSDRDALIEKYGSVQNFSHFSKE